MAAELGLGFICQQKMGQNNEHVQLLVSEASNRVSMSILYMYIIICCNAGRGYVKRAGLNQYERRAGHP